MKKFSIPHFAFRSTLRPFNFQPSQYNFRFFSALMMLVLLVGCSKNENEVTDPIVNTDDLPNCSNGYRLKSDNTTTFHYDTQGRLIKKVSNEPNGENTFVLEYNASNWVDKMTKTNKNNGVERVMHIYTFNYLPSGKISTMVDENIDDGISATHYYTLNNDGNPIVDSLVNDLTGQKLIYRYEWNGNNMIKSQFIGNNEYQCEYDNKPNPYYPFKQVYFPDAIGIFGWSENNLVKIKYIKNGNVISENSGNIKYYSNGLIKSNTNNNFMYECK